jgi:hypothetical protein
LFQALAQAIWLLAHATKATGQQVPVLNLELPEEEEIETYEVDVLKQRYLSEKVLRRWCNEEKANAAVAPDFVRDLWNKKGSARQKLIDDLVKNNFDKDCLLTPGLIVRRSDTLFHETSIAIIIPS